MAYNELIKNFNRIRKYMREFYVYGFKSRDDYTDKSARSYDDERRRLESWLRRNIGFRMTEEGKVIFISVDSRWTDRHNPLYAGWKAKSFTDGDITFHFILMDILEDADEALSVPEIMDRVDMFLSEFDEPRLFDESTVRKKLREYVSEGIIGVEKKGKTNYYRRAEMDNYYSLDTLDFFSEVAPCGVIGSFILDKVNGSPGRFLFKHHYITGALDSEVMYQLFIAMREKKSVLLSRINRNGENLKENHVVPLQIMLSVQGGRQYLMAFSERVNRITSYRLDSIQSVLLEEHCDRFDDLRKRFEEMRPHLWGVSLQGRSGERMDHVEFTIRYEDDEDHIPKRLEREKRCGTVERVDEHTCRFSADVFDAEELVPWIRTFICRITEIHFSDERLEKKFRQDIDEMYRMYESGGDEI